MGHKKTIAYKDNSFSIKVVYRSYLIFVIRIIQEIEGQRKTQGVF